MATSKMPLLLAGFLALMLLFGCLGGARERVSGGASGAEQASQQPGQPQSGGKIGDADISTAEDEDENAILTEEALVPPADETAKNASAFALDDSDLFVESMGDDILISEEDIVEPA